MLEPRLDLRYLCYLLYKKLLWWPAPVVQMTPVRTSGGIFWTTLQAHSDSVCSSWDKNGPIPEVTGFLGFMAWEKSYEPAVPVCVR